MLSISTIFTTFQIENADALMDKLESFGNIGIELEYRISSETYRQMKPRLLRSHLRISSIHNYFPRPDGIPKEKSSGDLFILSSLDIDMRQQAIYWTQKSIEHAHDHGAKAVVLHCGYIDIESEHRVFENFFNTGQIQSQAAQAKIQEKLTEREKKKAPYLNSLLYSLDKLLPVAEKYHVTLGLENRYYYHQLPGIIEMGQILSEFKGAPLGYWHDMGHARANELLGFLEPESLLKTYADNLIGIHIHDAKGLSDHLPLGTGDIDFQHIKPYIKDNTILVIELKPGTTESQVWDSIHFLHNIGIV
ncbi:MAG: TIM barrel protein [Desulfobacterales bacterium]|nr:TIM barrel protein [Desulfobacterales bacterium]